jgi:hypothetical protein
LCQLLCAPSQSICLTAPELFTSTWPFASQ